MRDRTEKRRLNILRIHRVGHFGSDLGLSPASLEDDATELRRQLPHSNSSTFFESGTYGHASALSMDSAAPVAEPAQHPNLAEPEDAGYVLTDLDQRALAMEAPLGLWPTVVETQRSA